MKRFLTIFTIFTIVVIATLLYAAGDATTYNTTTNYTEGRTGTDYVLYSGVTATTTALDSIGIHYTKAMYIAPFQGATDYAYIDLTIYNSAKGTEDCNVIIEYTFNPANINSWVTGSAASGVVKDQLASGTVDDTLNVISGTSDLAFRVYPYMRIKFDWQAANPSGTYVTWRVRLKKPTDTDFPKGQGAVISMATS